MASDPSFQLLLRQRLLEARGEGFRLLFQALLDAAPEETEPVLQQVLSAAPEKLVCLRLSELGRIEYHLGTQIRNDILKVAEEHAESSADPGPRFGSPENFAALFEACYQHDPELGWQIFQAATPQERRCLTTEQVGELLSHEDPARREAVLRELGRSAPSSRTP